MSELAEIVLMNPPAMTKMVDRMVADGLVQRQIGREDQRRVTLILTEHGDRISLECPRTGGRAERSSCRAIRPRKSKAHT